MRSFMCPLECSNVARDFDECRRNRGVPGVGVRRQKSHNFSLTRRLKLLLILVNRSALFVSLRCRWHLFAPQRNEERRDKSDP